MAGCWVSPVFLFGVGSSSYSPARLSLPHKAKAVFGICERGAPGGRAGSGAGCWGGEQLGKAHLTLFPQVKLPSLPLSPSAVSMVKVSSVSGRACPGQMVMLMITATIADTHPSPSVVQRLS